MKWFATSMLSCAVAGLAMSAAFAQDSGHDMASMPGMADMHAQDIPAAVARAVNDPGRAEDA
jgi:stage V sporulation protein SpoVS